MLKFIDHTFCLTKNATEMRELQKDTKPQVSNFKVEMKKIIKKMEFFKIEISLLFKIAIELF